MNALLFLAALLACSARAQPVQPDFDDGVDVGRFLETARTAAAAEPAPLRRRAAVSASRSQDGAILLSGADCSVLEAQAAALASWKTTLHETPAAPASCRCSAAGCSLDASSAAPDFVNRTHGTRAERWGPNCWNTALVADKILPQSGFTSPEEMTYWMSSPLCRSLRAGETPLPGDIIAVRDRTEREIHGFIYLTGALSFSKNSLTTASPFALQDPEDVYREFPVADGCRAPGAPAAACPAHSDYFRCVAWEDYLRSAGLSLTEEYLGTAAQVLELERSVGNLVFHWQRGPASRAEAHARLASAADSLLPLRALARSRSGLVWDALALRIDGLLHQIALM